MHPCEETLHPEETKKIELMTGTCVRVREERANAPLMHPFTAHP